MQGLGEGEEAAGPSLHLTVAMHVMLNNDKGDVRQFNAVAFGDSCPQEKKDAVLEKTADMKDKAAAASDKTLSKEDRAKNMKELLGKLKGTKDFMKINLAVFEYNEKNKAINKKDGKSEATKSVLDDMSLERESEELVDHVTQDLEDRKSVV